MRILLIPLAIAAATPGLADINVSFIESAPKDRFSLTRSESACQEGPMDITIDLSGSEAGLIFDVTSQGQGVSVFQPFEMGAGADMVLRQPKVNDGDTRLTLALSAFPAGQMIDFTIDLDDTIGARETTISNAEITGAQVIVSMGDQVTTGAFGPDARAIVPTMGCTS